MRGQGWLFLLLPRNFFVFFLILCQGCGYRWEPTPFLDKTVSISVPFIRGDSDGSLTQALVYALVSSGLAQVTHRNPDYVLKVNITGLDHRVIGYRRDSQKNNGKIQKNLVPSEGRKIIRVDAVLYKGESSVNILSGPFSIEMDVDYDHLDGDSIQELVFIDPSGVQQTVLPFSLGQLEPKESAQEAAGRLLYRRVAAKIVETVYHAITGG